MNDRANPAVARSHATHPESKHGFAFGLAAYGLWGVLPIYFKLLGHISAFDIVAHRVLWSLPFLALLVIMARHWDRVRGVFAHGRTIGILSITAALIGLNWLLYTYAVTSGHISPRASAITSIRSPMFCLAASSSRSD